MEEIKINEFIKLDEDSQIEYITDLEFEEDTNFKWKLFYDVLNTEKISDLTRIETLDVIGASDIPKDKKDSIIDIILKYINDKKEDETFISHCIMALQNEDLFSKKVYSKALEIFLDSKENEDFRMNSYPIVLINSSKENLYNYFKQLQEDPNQLFVDSSSRWLEELEEE